MVIGRALTHERMRAADRPWKSVIFGFETLFKFEGDQMPIEISRLVQATHDEPELITLKQAAELGSICLSTFRRLSESDPEFPKKAYLSNRTVRISLSAIREYYKKKGGLLWALFRTSPPAKKCGNY